MHTLAEAAVLLRPTQENPLLHFSFPHPDRFHHQPEAWAHHRARTRSNEGLWFCACAEGWRQQQHNSHAQRVHEGRKAARCTPDAMFSLELCLAREMASRFERRCLEDTRRVEKGGRHVVVVEEESSVWVSDEGVGGCQMGGQRADAFDGGGTRSPFRVCTCARGADSAGVSWRGVSHFGKARGSKAIPYRTSSMEDECAEGFWYKGSDDYSDGL
ncbi:hypothetical protein PMIN01_07498 [Paraphaeosphaeria minitans]|uniref:Uncharacterized protein n=1 Tax=Paraphaeosphaeria minitans TaxID=565426 RepID=A0A9P6GGJ4_9PLEO|nr:hypothetical protein PMIN01_07498 [Paraphaeosphaeria minitans]